MLDFIIGGCLGALIMAILFCVWSALTIKDRHDDDKLRADLMRAARLK